ncbi:MAG: type III pantothenate kinase, partial [Sphingobacteriaceae bacterium]|nr:type III pantothenate kinase [Sphingobacteriaceae bacterium]
VKPVPKDIVEVLKHETRYISFSTKQKVSIRNRYKSPQSLGLDRWAKVIAAHQLYPHQNCLLIDAGTCLTYDVLTASSEYFGGSISLGIAMRLKALNHYTSALPLVDRPQKGKKIPKGTNTENAILNGVLQGFLHEVRGVIAETNEQYPQCKILITGGDSDFLRKELKKNTFASQIDYNKYLVLKGLNEVIKLTYV